MTTLAKGIIIGIVAVVLLVVVSLGVLVVAGFMDGKPRSGMVTRLRHSRT